MKRITIVLLTLFIVATVTAQRVQHRDTLQFAAWKQEIFRAPVLTGEAQPQIIVPHQQPLCFNVEFDVKLTIASRTIVEQALFVNPGMGLTGYLPPSGNGLANLILPEVPGFNFSVISMKGNVFQYSTKKGKNDVPEFWVSTSNTDTHPYTPVTAPGQPESATYLYRKSETARYCSQNLIATAYRHDAGTSTWFIYGDHFPEKLHPKNYLGNFGVGYLYCEEGLFLVVEMRTASYQCKVTDIQNVHECLNTQPFRELQQQFVTKRTEDIQAERDKIAHDEANVSGPCSAEKMAVINFRKEMARKHEEDVRASQTGNTVQAGAAQRAMLDMMDPIYSVQAGILQAKEGICSSQNALAKGERGAASRLECLQQQLQTLQSVEQQMHALDTQYATNPARANAEKSRLYLHAMAQTCN